MEKQSGGRRPLGIALVSTLLVVLAIFLVFLYQTQESHRDGIVMPTPPEVDATEEVEQDNETTPFLTVEPDNVAKVIATMERPVAYCQQVELTTYFDSQTATQTVTTWRNGALQKAVVDNGTTEKHLLTQGEKVWIWYGGDKTSVALTLGPDITFENLLAMPTYETVAKLSPKDMTQGAFVTDDTGSYLQVETAPLPQVMTYTIDTETQLLVKASGWLDGLQTTAFAQTALEILSPQDEVFVDHWKTPEGILVSEATEN